MSLTKFTESINIIAGLDDKPSLTASELKAKFDEADGKLKTYLNNTLTTEVEQLVATEKTALQNSISSLSTSTTNSINELRTAENEMISDNYSITTTYKVGDLCIYNNALYKCTTAIEEGEAWNSSHWEQTTLKKSIKGKILYENNIGTSGTVNLSESLQIGDEIEIIYCRRRVSDGTSILKSTGKIPYTTNREIALNINYAPSLTTMQVISKLIAVNQNQITVTREITSIDSSTPTETASIYILKVIKY